MKKIPLILLLGIATVSCNPKFYDGEGNRIPIKVVKLFVISQFANMSPQEQQKIDKYFYTLRRFPPLKP